jgi:hypothetical protein
MHRKGQKQRAQMEKLELRLAGFTNVPKWQEKRFPMRRYAQVTIRKYIFKDKYVTIYVYISIYTYMHE